MPSKYVVVSGVLFGVIAVLQAVRALNGWPVQVGGFDYQCGFLGLRWSLLAACAYGHFGPGTNSVVKDSLFEEATAAAPPNHVRRLGDRRLERTVQQRCCWMPVAHCAPAPAQLCRFGITRRSLRLRLMCSGVAETWSVRNHGAHECSSTTSPSSTRCSRPTCWPSKPEWPQMRA